MLIETKCYQLNEQEVPFVRSFKYGQTRLSLKMNNMESSISFLFSCLGYSRTQLISWCRVLFLQADRSPARHFVNYLRAAVTISEYIAQMAGWLVGDA